MEDLQQAKTVAVKACSACSAGLLDGDNFCRWCGARQPYTDARYVSQVSRVPLEHVTQASSLCAEARRPRALAKSQAESVACTATSCATVALAGETRADVYRRISG